MENKEIAQVTIRLGSTLNMGNYETLRIDVSLTYPCKATDKEVNKTFEHVFKKTKKLMDKKIFELTGRGNNGSGKVKS